YNPTPQYTHQKKRPYHKRNASAAALRGAALFFACENDAAHDLTPYFSSIVKKSPRPTRVFGDFTRRC
ncbi:MAG: hypothetical protein IKL01_06280, partial [Mailhella sp.]|nr:hypothetical protein [Mailhella sp.]